jgi:hypothetical protein
MWPWKRSIASCAPAGMLPSALRTKETDHAAVGVKPHAAVVHPDIGTNGLAGQDRRAGRRVAAVPRNIAAPAAIVGPARPTVLLASIDRRDTGLSGQVDGAWSSIPLRSSRGMGANGV